MGNAVVLSVLVVLVAAISASLIKGKMKGKSSCGGSCGHCAMGGVCHSNAPVHSGGPGNSGEASPVLEGEVSPPLQSPRADSCPPVSSATPSTGSNAARNACLSDGVQKPLLLKIEGMSCSMCESHINDAVRNHFKVKSVRSSHKTGLVQIMSKESLDLEKVKKVIEETGYTVTNAW